MTQRNTRAHPGESGPPPRVEIVSWDNGGGEAWALLDVATGGYAGWMGFATRDEAEDYARSYGCEIGEP